MKRALSLIMAIVTCLSCCVLFASCGHECEWSADWSKDATHHWKACTGEDCAEVNEKAEHTWGAGTEVAFGATQYACTVCAQTKVDEANTEVAADKWAEAFNLGENYKVSAGMSDGTATTSLSVIRDGKKLHFASSMTIEGVTRTNVGYFVESGSMLYGFEEIDGEFEKFPMNGVTLAEYESRMLGEIVLEQFKTAAGFTYNAETNLYTCADIVEDGEGAKSISIGFIDGKLVKISFTFVNGEDSAPMTANFEYGNASVTVPAIDGATVTADQWNTALNFSTSNNYIEQNITYKDGTLEEFDIGCYGAILVYSIKDNPSYFVKDGDEYYVYMSLDGVEYERSSIPPSTYDMMKATFNFNTPMAYDKFTYDDSVHAYVCASIEYEGTTLSNISIHFNDGKVEYIIYDGEGPTGEDASITILPRTDNTIPGLPAVGGN